MRAFKTFNSVHDELKFARITLSLLNTVYPGTCCCSLRVLFQWYNIAFDIKFVMKWSYLYNGDPYTYIDNATSRFPYDNTVPVTEPLGMRVNLSDDSTRNDNKPTAKSCGYLWDITKGSPNGNCNWFSSRIYTFKTKHNHILFSLLWFSRCYCNGCKTSSFTLCHAIWKGSLWFISQATVPTLKFSTT